MPVWVDTVLLLLVVVSVCVRAHLCITEYARREARCCSPPYFLGESLSLELKLSVSARLTGQQARRIVLSLAGITGKTAMCGFYIGAGHPP